MLGLGLGLQSRGVVFNPASLFAGGGVGFVLDASILSALSQDNAGATPVTAAGQSVGRVMDQSGGARHATQATAANKPTYRVSASGRPYLEFDGSNDGLDVASATYAAGGRTVVSAFLVRTDAINRRIVETSPAWTTAAGGFGQVLHQTDATALRSVHQTTTGANAIGPISHTASQPVIFTSRFVDGGHIARINGAQVGTSTPTGTLPSLAAAVTIGYGSALPLAMDMYAMLVIDRALTTAEILQVEMWAASRCGIKL